MTWGGGGGKGALWCSQEPHRILAQQRCSPTLSGLWAAEFSAAVLFSRLICSYVSNATFYPETAIFFWGGGVGGRWKLYTNPVQKPPGSWKDPLCRPLPPPHRIACCGVGVGLGAAPHPPTPPSPALCAPPPQRCGFHASSLCCRGSGVAPGCSARPKSGTGASAAPLPLPPFPLNPSVGCGAVWGSVGCSLWCWHRWISVCYGGETEARADAGRMELCSLGST